MVASLWMPLTASQTVRCRNNTDSGSSKLPQLHTPPTILAPMLPIRTYTVPFFRKWLVGRERCENLAHKV